MAGGDWVNKVVRTGLCAVTERSSSGVGVIDRLHSDRTEACADHTLSASSITPTNASTKPEGQFFHAEWTEVFEETSVQALTAQRSFAGAALGLLRISSDAVEARREPEEIHPCPH